MQRSVDALRGRVARYLFVSSISVYASFDRDGLDEDAPLSPAPEPLPEVLDLALYGPLKAGCEAVVRAAYGERATLTMGEVLEACRAVSGSDAHFEWIDDARLLEAGVAPWRELLLWIPESDSAMRAMMGASLVRARDMGPAWRPLAETIAWSRTRAADHAWKAGLTPDRERALLESARTGSGPSTAPPHRVG